MKEFNNLYDLLNDGFYISNFKNITIEANDVSFLWYKEVYSNLTDCIQFPIPWLLIITEFAMDTPSLAPNVFFALEIYNDCWNMRWNILDNNIYLMKLQQK